MISETTSPAPALHHVCIVVADLDVAREFYVTVMGAVEDVRPRDFVFKGAYFLIGTAEVHVVQEGRPGHLASHTPNWSTDELSTGLVTHYALMVEDVSVYIDRLRERGIERVGGYRVRDDYVEQVYIADPDGNVIELMQRHSEHHGRLRRQAIWDDGTAVPVAPGFDLIDPRQRYGSF
ncbi:MULTISPECIES: VOC family protein [Microbacterium]|uniref:VOC family protein n=1 Tax=Microbacterium TaxID=33882 RepID=UPI0027812221|nr:MULTISPECIES: VOC family protein [Microbacterium]MDQ1082735.1 glyoxylase I family protein [Microbacterium sp. SORGH_AS_0344]MDQ1168495.1 glyoxylase I family protein [Microbacterium proteolyticum]